MTFIVPLISTGEIVDVSTLDGANAFLEQPTGTDGFNFFSTDLKTVNAIRKRERKKGKLNNTDRQTLKYIYRKIFHVADVGEPKLFREKVPKTELEAYLNHVVEILRRLSNDRKWINTGNLLEHDFYVMTSLVGLFLHPPAVALAFDEIKVLEHISDMISSLEKPLAADYADRVVGIVEHTYDSCRHEFDKKWKAEKTFKKLESTGILVHFLRCSAVEGITLATQESAMFNDLLASPAYLQKRFKEGTPCGDTVRAIVKGTDGHSPCTRVLPYMNSLIQLSSTEADEVFSLFVGSKVPCHFCRKRRPEEDLKFCSKCGQAQYCSKECQRAHWKTHKKVCEAPLSSRDKKNISSLKPLVNDFLFRGYVHIMLRMVKECDKAGAWNFNEMVLELDLRPDENGTIPMMKDPPEIRIVPFTKYLDGTCSNEPGSLFAGQEKDSFLPTLQDCQSRRRSTELLCVVAHGSSYHYSMQERGLDNQKHRFCQEALEAFRSLKMDKDISLLWEIFSSEPSREYILIQLGMKETIASPNSCPIICSIED